MTTHSMTSRSDLRRHLLFVTTPALWPAWPLLPLIRRANGTEELGVMFDALGVCQVAGFSSAVLRCNLFELPSTVEQLLALPKEIFDCGEELIQAGWRVD